MVRGGPAVLIVAEGAGAAQVEAGVLFAWLYERKKNGEFIAKKFPWNSVATIAVHLFDSSRLTEWSKSWHRSFSFRRVARPW